MNFEINKRVLHVISNTDPALGGVSQALRTMIHGLEEKGVHNEVVSVDDPNALYIKSFSFVIHAMGPSKGPWQYSSHFSPWLIRNLERFDFIIIHGIWLFHGYAVHKVLKKLKRNALLESNYQIPKVFLFPHGMLDPYFQLASGRKLKAIRNKVYWRFIEKRIINEADGILFTAEEEKQMARHCFSSYKPKREIVVGMGLEMPPPYSPSMREAFIAKCSNLKDYKYFLFLSRIHEKKGVDILITAYADILSKIDCKQQMPKLIIAGPGLETLYGKKIFDLVSESPILASNIYFTGMLSGMEKWGAFYGCEAFILPTHQENFGFAIVEALACSKAVLISNRTNIWGEIENGGAGIIQLDTFEGTKSLLSKWLAKSGQEKIDFAQRAFKTYQLNFSMDSFLKRWTDYLLDTQF